MNFFRCLALVLLVAWIGSTASAQTPSPLRLERSSDASALGPGALAWIDDKAYRTAEEIAAGASRLAWEPFQPQRQHRIDGKALWLQFDAATPPDSRWYLVLMHPSVDLIELHYRRPDGRWVTQSAGQTLSTEDWSVPGRLPTFELAPPSDGSTRYWVRVLRERSEVSLPLHFYSQSAVLELRAFEQFTLGGYFGVLVFLAAASVVAALVWRDRNFGAFAVYLAGIVAIQLVYLGVGAQHLWTDWPHWNAMAHLVVPGCAVAACLWFVKVLTGPARFSRLLDLATWGLIAALLGATALNGFIATRGSATLVALLLGATLPLAGGLLVLAWRRGRDPYLGLMVAAFVPTIVGALLPIAYVLGLLPEGLLTRHGLTFGTALQLPLTYYALSRRAHRRREPGLRAAQLTHTDTLTGLCDRDTLLRRLDESLRRAISQRHQCAVLAVRLTNHDALDYEFGRATAERALLVAASILRSAASDIDLAARIGERDFALLLEGPTTGEVAMSRAQQIVAQGLQHASALPPATTLKFHVAVTLLPDHELDSSRCLRWLEEACNAMRAEPRRAIRPLNF
ncbi:sensor domain-containing diguanylate cyclase [Ramlibacter rhizophilus]|uniref:Diguanylate cyclase n=1 Tax=Ramlibacter rhizophilus TaxID=1781167 RepID=A0A4Z0BQR3_9BURK|nr:7TM diverse intracellular signaling domain-containing protein [Ramlibacter rhizophilus]TFZ01112.1 diguanylate cyclase [Ramlibacter rhizophilus]